MSEILIRNADAVATMNAARAELAGGDVLIRGGIIAEVGQGLATTGEVIEARGCVVTPGLVNTHHHLYQTLTRAVPGGQDALLFGWLKTLYPIWSRFGPEEMRVSALAGLAEDAGDGADQIEEALESGRAAETFGRMVAALGGPSDFVERYPDRLPSAPVLFDVVAEEDGFIAEIDSEALGHAVVKLGGGRLRGGDRINPSVGLSEIMPIGEPVEAGEAIVRIHAANPGDAEKAREAVQAAIRISPDEPEEPPLIHQRIS